MTNSCTPWIEKYRPTNLNEVVGNSGAIKRLQQIVSNGAPENLILSGPAGCGKTTSAKCFARELLGENLMKSAFLEMNASDERRIEDVRQKIKSFCQRKVNLPPNRYKIILLDESDSMTEGAQGALRLIMKTHQDTTKFIFACNDGSAIIEPIQTSCTIIRFKSLSTRELTQRILNVIDLESVQYTPDGLEKLLYLAEGDMRLALNYLQSTSQGLGEITEDNLFKICDQPQPQIAKEFLQFCLNGPTGFNDANKKLKLLLDKGYCVTDIAKTISKVAVLEKDLYKGNTRLQLLVVNQIANTMRRTTSGLQTYLQLSGLASEICNLSQN